MHNSEILQLLDECEKEICYIADIIKDKPFDVINAYLTRYCIIKACGTIEIAFKKLVANRLGRRCQTLVKCYINNTIIKSSTNPSYDKLCETLKRIDETWNQSFKETMKANTEYTRYRISLNSMVDLRNAFAHGGNPDSTINNIYAYFQDAKQIMIIVDSIIC